MSVQFGGATPLLLLFALAFGALVIRYSAAGVPVLVAFVYLNVSETLVRYHDFPSLLQFLVAGLAFAAWLHRDTERLRLVGTQRLTILAGVYLLVVFASTAWAADRDLADARLGDIARAVVIYALLTLLMHTRERVLQGVAALVAAAAAISLLILVQVATGQYDNEFGGLARVKDAHLYGDVFQARIAGPNGDPNFFARMLLLAIPPAAVFAFQARGRWQRRASLLATIVITAALAVTYSRGGMVALAVMAVMLLRALHVRWQSTVAVGAAMLLVLVLLPASVTQRFVTIEEFLPGHEEMLEPDSSFEERRLLMSVAWGMFGANPFGGVGIANYSARYDDYIGSASSAFRQYGDASDRHYPHNLALEVASETGLIGLFAFGALIVVCWRTFAGVERASARSDLAPVASALKISLAGFLVASVFLHLAEPRTLFLLFAFAASLERLES